MKHPSHFRLKALLLALSGISAVCSVQAQTGLSDAASKTQVVPGERLSDWLLRNAGPDTDRTALHWRVQAEQEQQQRLRAAVVDGLRGTGSATPLSEWLTHLPLTGRLVLAQHDPRWMQAAPQEDPELGDGQSVVLLKRPDYVAVLQESGEICLLRHRAGAFASDYLAACPRAPGAADDDAAADQAWVTQPDGRVSQVSLQAWNQQAQDEPAPGAWLWAPSRRSGVAASTSSNLARLMATQMPAEALMAELEAPVRRAEVPPAASLASTPRNRELTANDWGEIGLLQTPTARMEKAGAVRLAVSAVWPYTRGNVMLQPFDWLEAGFRYTDISNQLYGPTIAGGQTYKDKSIDIKVRLWEEDAAWPQLALGLRDIGGTGLFSSEYLVANKRWGNWDASLGLGWGYLGARGDIQAPLGFLAESFKTRAGNNTPTGGSVNSQSMFHGNAALFGGVQWHTPLPGLLAKLELDGNNYRNEPFGTVLPASSPLNWGLAYRYTPYVDFSAAWERGERLALGVTLHAELDKLTAPKVLDPALPRVAPLPALTMPAPALAPQDWSALSAAVQLHTGWQVSAMNQQGDTLVLQAQTVDALFVQERVERAVTVLHAMLPPAIRRFELDLGTRGIAFSKVKIARADWVAQRTRASPPSRMVAAEELTAALAPSNVPGDEPSAPAGYRKPAGAKLEMEWGPSYSQILGGPDGFLLYELGLQAKLEKHFTPNTWLSGNANLRLLDNYAGFKYDAPSNLPRVRTYAREYVTTARLTLPHLQLTHVADMGSGHYASVYGGLLESMYAGVGAEWLYRPWQSRLAFGVDVNRVRQRAFEQNLGLRDYAVTTGHATAYWDTGWNDLQVKLSAGQYLAGDKGATLDVSRVFANGTAIGAWATKTNVSAEQFGEGSFDKGIYVTIPFDVMLPKSGSGVANAVWNPLTRDGGARLNRRFGLFDMTRQNDTRAWSSSSAPAATNPGRRRTAADGAYVLTEPAPGAALTMGRAAGGVATGIADVPAGNWLLGGGAVLAAGLLDTKVDDWFQNHQSDSMDRAASASNGIPYVLALGSGLLLTGLGGQAYAETAKTSITAAAVALGANYLGKFAVGRSRPAADMGPSSFNGMTGSAVQSSFASNHVTAAFALVTPFARQYDKPWLYAVAASSSLGRMHDREHWLSDVVAAGLLGYLSGSVASDQQLGHQRGMRITATPQSVSAEWMF